jgi:hypothetical protein
MRQLHDRYMVAWFRVRVDLVSKHFERDVYTQQVLLFFRRHGLSGSLQFGEVLSIQYESLHDSRPDNTFSRDM